jgi:hypothetical protein
LIGDVNPADSGRYSAPATSLTAIVLPAWTGFLRLGIRLSSKNRNYLLSGWLMSTVSIGIDFDKRWRRARPVAEYFGYRFFNPLEMTPDRAGQLRLETRFSLLSRNYLQSTNYGALCQWASASDDLLGLDKGIAGVRDGVRLVS